MKWSVNWNNSIWTGLTLEITKPNIPWELRQTHHCWCHGSLGHQAISSRIITHGRWTEKRIPVFHEEVYQLHVPSQSKERKKNCNYIFMFPKMKSARKGLIWLKSILPDFKVPNVKSTTDRTALAPFQRLLKTMGCSNLCFVLILK